jgi:flagellar hook-associated protein 3 FlgL
MPVTTVSETGKNYYNGIIIRDLNFKLQSMMGQIATGKKSDTYGGLGGDASLSLSLRNRAIQLNGYSSAINNIKLRTTSMSQAMQDVSTSTNSVLSKMNSISQGGTPNISILKTAAQSALDEIMSRLNTRVDGKYVFSAVMTDTAPVTNTSLAATNIATEVGNYETGTSAATIIANIDAMTDAQLGFHADLAGAADINIRIDDSLDVDYTVKANEDSFKDVISGLAMIANIDYDSTHASEFWSLFNEAKSRIDTGSRALTLRNGQLGVSVGQMTNTLEAHKNTLLALESNISDVEDVDVAAVSANMQTLQFQIQATYATISQTSKLSILDYL